MSLLNVQWCVIEAIQKYKEKHGEDGVIEQYQKNHGTYKDIEKYLEKKQLDNYKN